MKFLLIGAASAAVLGLAGPAAAQYPPPPPPPSDADQYNAPRAQPPYDRGAPNQADQDSDQADQDAMGPPGDQDQGDDQDQDQMGPNGPDQDQAGPPPGYSQSQGQAYGQDRGPSGPPPQGQYGQGQYDRGQNDQAAGDQGPPPPDYRQGPGRPAQRFEGGPDAEPGEDLIQREDSLGQRIERMSQRGRLDPRAADAALSELRSIQDEQDQMMRRGGGLSSTDQERLNGRLDQLQHRLRDMRRQG